LRELVRSDLSSLRRIAICYSRIPRIKRILTHYYV